MPSGSSFVRTLRAPYQFRSSAVRSRARLASLIEPFGSRRSAGTSSALSTNSGLTKILRSRSSSRNRLTIARSTPGPTDRLTTSANVPTTTPMIVSAVRHLLLAHRREGEAPDVGGAGVAVLR